MTPLGVLYKSHHDSESAAMKFAEWGVKVFGGAATPFDLIGPGAKGFYESAMRLIVPENVQWVKEPWETDLSWMKKLELAYILFDSLEVPTALYFHQHETLLKPGVSPPLIAHFVLDLRQ